MDLSSCTKMRKYAHLDCTLHMLPLLKLRLQFNRCTKKGLFWAPGCSIWTISHNATVKSLLYWYKFNCYITGTVPFDLFIIQMHSQSACTTSSSIKKGLKQFEAKLTILEVNHYLHHTHGMIQRLYFRLDMDLRLPLPLEAVLRQESYTNYYIIPSQYSSQLNTSDIG